MDKLVDAVGHELLDVLDDDVLERISSLRHNARQLGVAREGKLV